MIYDLIIIGGGAAGLFAGASLPQKINGLIIEKSASPGKKLLMSGSGQCNLTHCGSIKDFLSHYGNQGKSIRSVLYQFNNDALISFFNQRGLPTIAREDGKIFPKSMKAQKVLDCLTSLCKENGLSLITSSNVIALEQDEKSNRYSVICKDQTYRSKKIIVATGGCSYPTTGSDGSFFSVLTKLGICINPLRPALAPIYVEGYPYAELSGTSFDTVKLQIRSKEGKKIAERSDSLLFTHKNLSGPVILNSSRFAVSGSYLQIQYVPSLSKEELFGLLREKHDGNQKQLLSVLQELLPLPKRFLEVICKRLSLSANQKFSQTAGSDIKRLADLLTNDTYRISRLEEFNKSMATSGGISLSEVHLKTMESKRFPHLYFAGEILDVDGDTGGYNLQFAFSSAYVAAQQI
ncbi:NAD(P)/FAD-dependent oxidoreductase [Sinanaerobacter sp. ZZT-01]|uniref:NAD(P)/FAD-dependent oxidoreductase n=1 Tax=Sinanaerobacter sp. ZZT-01 TaxID=3111540 RepID=UPI002D789388|nr:NAD(P)/FAD-dependent oxidoreductase [Sinanaerobacter sp. ZZT-01]WRR92805.1 NAD(P)/FAD-dependent oxidoreductase [Sinanaerobacter sp. ZZT-01]